MIFQTVLQNYLGTNQINNFSIESSENFSYREIVMNGVTGRVPRYSLGLSDPEWNCRAPVPSREEVVPRAGAELTLLIQIQSVIIHLGSCHSEQD